jgi:hypothetical protein
MKHEPAPHPVEAAAQEAARKLMTLKFARVVGVPDMNDANRAVDDIYAIAAIFDPVIEALGNYAADVFGIPERSMDGCHVDQVRGALEGNLTFLIGEAVRESVREQLNDAYLGRV